MAFQRPTLRTLVDQAIAQINSRLPGADARLRHSNLNVLAHVVAGATHGAYGKLDYMSRQILSTTADSEFLEVHASELGMSRKAAARASGYLEVSGVAGTEIPAGTIFQRSDNERFQVITTVSMTGESASVHVSAVNAGAGGNTSAGTQMTIVSTIVGLNTSATVGSDGITGGTDIESDESLRDRLLSRKRNVPMGGSAADFIAWAREVPGVTRAWVSSNSPNVTLYFVRDGDGDGTASLPSAEQVARVHAYIEERRPMGAVLTTRAPAPNVVNFNISVLPDTESVRESVRSRLIALFREEGEVGGQILISHIRAAVSSADGEVDNTVYSPAGDVSGVVGAIPIVGEITWQ